MRDRSRLTVLWFLIKCVTRTLYYDNNLLIQLIQRVYTHYHSPVDAHSTPRTQSSCPCRDMALCSYCRGIKKGQTLPSNCGNSKESVHTKNIKEHFLKEISTRAYLPIGLHIEMHPRVITSTGQYGNCEKKFSHSHKSTRIHTHTHTLSLSQQASCIYIPI